MLRLGLIFLISIQGVIIAQEQNVVHREMSFYVSEGKEILQGPFLESIAGQNLVKGSYQDGKKVGLWETWHPNGLPASEQTWTDGIPDGLCREWSASGNIIKKVLFVAGQKSGFEEEWFENGVRKLYVQWEQGIQNGPLQEWYESGKEKLRCLYVAGEKDGPLKEWNESGELIREELYQKGVMRKILLASEKYNNENMKVVYSYYLDDQHQEIRHGSFCKWFPNGEVWIKCQYVHGELDGLWQYGKLDGLQCRQENYKMGVKHGAFKWFHQGQLVREEIWRDGELVSQNRY